jgi:hypothetical protein
MDWRHLEELPVARHGEVKNLCVWVKDNAGMGSLSKTRVVRDGNVITAGGVTSDIDVGLRRVAEICRRHSRAGNPARHRVRSGSTL